MTGNLNTCGCGAPAVYQTTTGPSCNKYLRCMTYEELRSSLRESNRMLLDMLAVIHGDGGHHTESVGIKDSLTDAYVKIVLWKHAHDIKGRK